MVVLGAQMDVVYKGKEQSLHKIEFVLVLKFSVCLI